MLSCRWTVEMAEGYVQACSAKRPRQLIPERAVFCLATQRRAARHLGAQETPEIDAIPCSQPSPFPAPSSLLTLSVPSCSTQLSFDPRGDQPVLKRAKDIFSLALRQSLSSYKSL